MQNINTLRKIGTLKKGTRFEMDDRQYEITRSGIGYTDVEFKSATADSKEILTTIHKNNKVEVIENTAEKLALSLWHKFKK